MFITTTLIIIIIIITGIPLLLIFASFKLPHIYYEMLVYEKKNYQLFLWDICF